MIFSVVMVTTTRGRDDRDSRREEDARLVEAVRGGDRRKFAELYRRHVDGVFGRLTRFVGPVPEREDLVQQVFLEVHRALPAYRGEASFSTFLHRIVVHVACDFLDARRRRPTQPLDEAAVSSLVAPGATPEAQAREREALIQAFDCLALLKPAKRVAFVLVAVEGLSLDEAASLVGANPQAVKQRVLAARREVEARLARRDRSSGGRP